MSPPPSPPPLPLFTPPPPPHADYVNYVAPPGTPPGPGGATFYLHSLARAFSDHRWTASSGRSPLATETGTASTAADTPGTSSACRQRGATSRTGRCTSSGWSDGKGAEHWTVRDDAALMQQLAGAHPAPSARPKGHMRGRPRAHPHRTKRRACGGSARVPRMSTWRCRFWQRSSSSRRHAPRLSTAHGSSSVWRTDFDRAVR